jgi:LacI family transcriptional regulator
MSSLRDLAKRLNLSVTTVSRALDGFPDVAVATRERVQALAKELNYHPNAAARNLRKQKVDAVAVALPAAASHVGIAGLLNMLMETGRTLAESGLDLLMLPTHDAASELAGLRRLVEGRRADAVILLRTLRDDPRVTFLSERDIPFVTYGRTESTVAHAYIDGDGEQGFRDATKMLIDLGHQRIALVAAPQEFMFAFVRHAGWQRQMIAAGLDNTMTEMAGEPTEVGGRSCAIKLLNQRPRPTALLCTTDAMAIGALTAVKDMNLVAGRDITIVGHDGLPSGIFTDPPLTTMTIAVPDVGTRLANLLVRRLQGTDSRALQELHPVAQVPRGTHAPPPK